MKVCEDDMAMLRLGSVTEAMICIVARWYGANGERVSVAERCCGK